MLWLKRRSLNRIVSTAFTEVFRKEALLIAGYALLITAVVYHYAWVSEDSFITFRYVLNTLDGYGPVFNAGENVQGYTHPLWFVLLVIGTRIFRNPIYVSIFYGLILTFLTVAIHGFFLLRLTHSRAHKVLLLALSSFVWIRSDSWLSFQTGGLENPLSHLLLLGICIEMWIHSASRPYWLILLISLLCLSRPDFLVLIAPFGILSLLRLRSIRELMAMSAVASPMLVWMLFAWLFYHNISPNTAYAKIGIYSSWGDGIRQGLAYLQDWLTYDTVMAGSSALFLGLAISRSRSKERLACLVGIALYLAWIIQVGGDFMRGRLLTPVFTGALVVGTFALAEHMQFKERALRLEAAVVLSLLSLFVAGQFIPDPGKSIPESGIVDERQYYPGYHLSFLLERGRLKNPYMDLRFAEDLKRYSQKCGHVTIHLRNPGTMGYLAGAQVSIIDTLGLTDAYIARLPREYLVSIHPRPGHPDKHIPISYLIERGDVAILPGWMESVKQGDCSLSTQLNNYEPSSELFTPP